MDTQIIVDEFQKLIYNKYIISTYDNKKWLSGNADDLIKEFQNILKEINKNS